MEQIIDKSININYITNNDEQISWMNTVMQLNSFRK